MYNQRLSYLRSFERWLVEEHEELDNLSLVWLKIKAKKAKKKEIKPFSIEEIDRILKAFQENTFSSRYSPCPDSFYADFVKFLFCTGCRPSEAIGLRWSDLDLTQGLIIISTVLARGDNGETAPSKRVRKERKTDTGRGSFVKPKILPMNGALKDMLLERMDLFKDLQGNHLVFPCYDAYTDHTYSRGYDDKNFLNRQWKRILNGLEIPYRCPYTGRHTMASHALAQGFTPVEVANLLGHTNTRMVVNTYGHFIDRPRKLPEMMSE